VYPLFADVHVRVVPPLELVAVTVYLAKKVVVAGAVHVTSAAPVVAAVATTGIVEGEPGVPGVYVKRTAPAEPSLPLNGPAPALLRVDLPPAP
jgi:hypothetical protein